MSRVKTEQPPASLSASVILIVAVLLTIAAVLFWDIFQKKSETTLTSNVTSIRDSILESTKSQIDKHIDTFSKKIQSPSVKEALLSGNAEVAANAIKENWPDADHAMVWAIDLDAAYADPEAFGYARLTLLETATYQNKLIVQVIKDDGNKLGIAAPVMFGSNPSTEAVAYARLPLESIISELENIDTPANTYISLRQGESVLFEKGDTSISYLSEVMAKPLNENGLRIAVAVPTTYSSIIPLTPEQATILAVICIFLSIVLIIVSKKKGMFIKEDVGNQVTLQERLLSDPTPLLEPVTPIIVISEDKKQEKVILINPDIFHGYDIRGEIGLDLTEETIRLLGQAIGTLMHEQSVEDIVIGSDGSDPSSDVINYLMEGLQQAGCHITNLGIIPTPLVHFATHQLKISCGISITASHSKEAHACFKIIIDGAPLLANQLEVICRYINDQRLHTTKYLAPIRNVNIIQEYIQAVTENIQGSIRRFRVVVDAGNASASIVAPQLLTALGCEVIPLFCDLEPSYPNHIPNFDKPSNLDKLIDAVKSYEADFGVIFDADANRMGVVTAAGEQIYGDRVSMLFISDILRKAPNSQIIYDAKCTSQLPLYIKKLGGRPIIEKSGHSLTINKMHEISAKFAVEMNGLFYFADRWYGFDDALYAMARLVEVLSSYKQSPTEVFNSMPTNRISTGEIRVPISKGSAHGLVELIIRGAELEDSVFSSAQLNTTDGLRADWAEGWGLIRASNTESCLVLRFEASEPEILAHIKDIFNQQIQSGGLTDAPMIF